MSLNTTSPRLIIGGDFNNTSQELRQLAERGHRVYDYLIEECYKT